MGVIEDGNKYIMNTYNRFPLEFEKGEGMYLYDNNGRKYLDFVAGIAVNSLGHNHKKLAEAITSQVNNLIHVSNLYYTKAQCSLAKKLVDNGALDKVFYCNSGAEAIEAALKLARKYGFATGRQEIITMRNSFHGRTFGAVTATGQDCYQEGFGDMLPNIKYAIFNDINSVKNTISSKTVAILLEPIQGEGGIIPADKNFLIELRRICDEKDILLMFDEVQCGVGRLGTLFAYQYYDIVPDVISMAKGIAGGVPCGIMMAKKRIAESFVQGDHASTFGGNPLATSAGNVVIDELLNGLLANINTMGKYLEMKLDELVSKYDIVLMRRGAGLMQGIELSIQARSIIASAIDKGLLLVGSGKNVIRFVPAYIVSSDDIDKAVEILEECLKLYLKP